MKVPEGVSVELKQGFFRVQGKLGVVEKKYDPRVVKIEERNGEITVEAKGKETRKVKATVGTAEAHLKNAFEGVTKGFEKHLVVVYAHFPITVEARKGEVVVKNFLGEKLPRKAVVVGDTKVEVKGQDVFVRGVDCDAVGQTAANIVASTRIRERDARKFQDGIYKAVE